MYCDMSIDKQTVTKTFLTKKLITYMDLDKPWLPGGAQDNLAFL